MIVIEPTNPQVIYVPQYNPQVVYTQAPATTIVIQEDDDDDEIIAGVIGFTAGIALGAAVNNNYYYGPYGWGGGAYMYNDAWDDYYDHREDAREDWADHREDLVEERGERREDAGSSAPSDRKTARRRAAMARRSAPTGRRTGPIRRRAARARRHAARTRRHAARVRRPAARMRRHARARRAPRHGDTVKAPPNDRAPRGAAPAPTRFQATRAENPSARRARVEDRAGAVRGAAVAVEAGADDIDAM